MRIGLLWKADYPWDVRIEKFARALSSRGHDVHVIAANTSCRAGREVLGEATVHRLPSVGPNWFRRIVNLPIFANPAWSLLLRRVLRDEALDLLIVRDLPLMPVGLSEARAAKVPILFDMAENYPALWEEVRGKGLQSNLASAIKNPAIARWIEKRSIMAADGTIVVVEESRERLLRLGADPNRVFIVSNTPDLSTFRGEATSTWADRWPGKTIILYQGYVNRARGLAAVVEGMSELSNRIENVKLVVAGTGNDHDRLREMVRARRTDEQVEFLGWVDHQSMASLVERADVGVVPHLATEHKNTTIPNKLFDFMAMSKPVITSSAAPLARIVTTENCGVVFTAGVPSSFVEAAWTLLASPELAKKLGMNGRKAVETRYNWKADQEVLNDVVRKVAKL